LDEIRTGKDKEIIILVDTDTSKENVLRAATSQGCRVKDVAPEGEGYRITIAKA
jgi:TusA-related sulfurtransferase